MVTLHDFIFRIKNKYSFIGDREQHQSTIHLVVLFCQIFMFCDLLSDPLLIGSAQQLVVADPCRKAMWQDEPEAFINKYILAFPLYDVDLHDGLQSPFNILNVWSSFFIWFFAHMLAKVPFILRSNASQVAQAHCVVHGLSYGRLGSCVPHKICL